MMKTWTGWQKLALVFLAIVGLSLSFITFLPFHFSHLIWVALVPWILLLRWNTTWGSIFWGALAASGYFAIVVYWIAMVTPPGYITTVLLFSLYLTLFNYFGHKTFRRFPRWGILAIPFLWLAVQYMRSNFFFFRFPWYLLGYAQVDSDWLIQTADLWGITGVTFLIALVNTAVAEWISWSIEKREERPYPALVLTGVAVVFLIFCPIYSHYRLENLKLRPSAKLAIIQGNIPQHVKASGKSLSQIQNEYMGLTKKALSRENVDLVVWPETMLTGIYIQPTRKVIASEKQPMLLGSARRYKKKKGGRVHYANSGFYFDKKAQLKGIYDKVYLVPLSEYIPFRESAPWLFRFFRSWIPKGFVSMTPGEKIEVFQVGNHTFAPSVCFEISFPEHCRTAARKGADCMINISNDAWFKDSAELDNARILGIVRAIETRKAVVRAVNAGISVIVHADGSAIDLENSQGEKKQIAGILIDTPQTTDDRTLYVRLGSWVAYLCLVLSGLWALVLLFYPAGKSEE